MTLSKMVCNSFRRRSRLTGLRRTMSNIFKACPLLSWKTRVSSKPSLTVPVASLAKVAKRALDFNLDCLINSDTLPAWEGDGRKMMPNCMSSRHLDHIREWLRARKPKLTNSSTRFEPSWKWRSCRLGENQSLELRWHIDASTPFLLTNSVLQW